MLNSRNFLTKLVKALSYISARCRGLSCASWRRSWRTQARRPGGGPANMRPAPRCAPHCRYSLMYGAAAAPGLGKSCTCSHTAPPKSNTRHQASWILGKYSEATSTFIFQSLAAGLSKKLNLVKVDACFASIFHFGKGDLARYKKLWAVCTVSHQKAIEDTCQHEFVGSEQDNQEAWRHSGSKMGEEDTALEYDDQTCASQRECAWVEDLET